MAYIGVSYTPVTPYETEAALLPDGQTKEGANHEV